MALPVERFVLADARLRAWMDRHGPTLLRVALGVVFVWFGALKVVGASPVSDLVLSVVPVDAAWVVPALGAYEVLVGVGLLANRLMRVVLALLAAQMLGTFLVLVVQPGVAFQGANPLLLTTEGEFVVKNLVLLAAALVVGAHVRPLPEDPRAWGRRGGARAQPRQ